MPGPLNAGLEEKPQEQITAVQCAFQLCSSGLLAVGQPSPPGQALRRELACRVPLS